MRKEAHQVESALNTISNLRLGRVMSRRGFIGASLGLVAAAGASEALAIAPDCKPKKEGENCVGYNEAAFVLTARHFVNANGKPGYQPHEGDYTLNNPEDIPAGTTYRIHNQQNPKQWADVVVGEDGVLRDEKTGSPVLVFTGERDPKVTAEVGGTKREALVVVARRKGAYDKTLKKTVPFGDPKEYRSAFACTPRHLEMVIDNSYLEVPVPVTATPETTTPVPAIEAPVQTPRRAPAQVPAAKPQSQINDGEESYGSVYGIVEVYEEAA